MEAVTVNCPNCAALLRVPGPPKPGRPVRCPRCTFTFPLPPEPAPRSPSPAPKPVLTEEQAAVERSPAPGPYDLQSPPAEKPPTIRRVRPRRFYPERSPVPWIPWAVGGLVSLAALAVITIAMVAVWRSGRFAGVWASRKAELSLAARSTPPGWQDVVSREGRFRVFMPGSPKTGDSVVHTRLGSLPVKFYDVESGDCGFSVFYGDLDSSGLGTISPEEWIDAVRDIYIVRSNANLLEEKILSFQGQFGKETRYEIPGHGKVARRMIAVKRRIYTINFAAKKQDLEEDVMARFFDSFETLPESP